MTVIKMYAGDSSPNVTFNLSRPDNSPVDITGATVKLVIQNPYTNKHTNDGHNSCSVTSATTCTYAWNTAGTDLPNPGIYKAELQIAYADGQDETYGLQIVAERRL